MITAASAPPAVICAADPAEAAKAALCEAAHVARLDQQLGDRPDGEAAELAQRRAALAHELLQRGDDLLLLAIQCLICAW